MAGHVGAHAEVLQIGKEGSTRRGCVAVSHRLRGRLGRRPLWPGGPLGASEVPRRRRRPLGSKFEPGYPVPQERPPTGEPPRVYARYIPVVYARYIHVP